MTIIIIIILSSSSYRLDFGSAILTYQHSILNILSLYFRSKFVAALTIMKRSRCGSSPAAGGTRRGWQSSRLIFLPRLLLLFVCLLRTPDTHAFVVKASIRDKIDATGRFFAEKNGNNNNNNNNKRKSFQPHPNDPRAYRRNRRIAEQRSLAKHKRQRDEEQATAAFDLPQQPLVQTLGGGTAMIFAMAQRMFEQQQQQTTNGAPRWRPATGIANDNPSFRTTSPNMNQQGYAGVIWRNVRKRRKPSLYKYALRTYDRMSPQPDNGANNNSNNNNNNNAATDGVVVRPTNIHHEGALVACAKLGLADRALAIYQRVQAESSSHKSSSSSSLSPSCTDTRRTVYVTEHMVSSVVRACVRAARTTRRRDALDQARDVLWNVGTDVVLDAASHVNPLAAAYQALGLHHEAAQVLTTLLGDRVIGPEPETGAPVLNVNDIGTKDKASYALLVQGAVTTQDWGAAVDNLTTMTEAGLFPTDRHWRAWTEISERKTKHRTTRSWKKKRDASWVVVGTVKNPNGAVVPTGVEK